jgi:hypothetical protein
MKYFIIYKQPSGSQIPWKKEYTQDEISALPNSSRLKFEKIKNEETIPLVKDGKLSFLKETSHHRIFHFSGSGLARVKSKKGVYTEVDFDLWQQKEGRLAASIEGTRYVSNCAIAFLSYSTYRDPFAISKSGLVKSDFVRLKNHIVEGLGGEVTQALMHDISNPELNFNVRDIYIKGSHLEKIQNFDEYLKASNRIKTMGFVVKVEETRFSFRITHWGGGQIFSPGEPLDHEVAVFLDLLDTVVGSGPSSG